MRLGFALGALLAFAPAALAQQNMPQTGQPMDRGAQETQLDQSNKRDRGNQPAQTGKLGESSKLGSKEDVMADKLLPKDAKLVGTVEETEVRAFPEQMGKTDEQASKIEKETVAGVSAVDRVWMTKQPYKRVVATLDQKLKGEGIEPIAKTITPSATAWNVRMPDGHIANLVVRNTQPTTIETVQAAVAAAEVEEHKANPNVPSSKMPKSNDTNLR